MHYEKTRTVIYASFKFYIWMSKVLDIFEDEDDIDYSVKKTSRSPQVDISNFIFLNAHTSIVLSHYKRLSLDS